MPRLYDQVKSLVASLLQRGLRYEVLIQKTLDSRKTFQLEKFLASRLREVQELSFSPNEVRLRLFSFQDKAAIRQLVFDAALQSGMPDFDLVMTRDNSFTFTTGLY